MPADEREYVLELLCEEGVVARAYADLGPDDELAADFFDDYDDDE